MNAVEHEAAETDIRQPALVHPTTELIDIMQESSGVSSVARKFHPYTWQKDGDVDALCNAKRTMKDNCRLPGTE